MMKVHLLIVSLLLVATMSTHSIQLTDAQAYGNTCINTVIRDMELEFYQEDNVTFIGCTLVNVSISITEVNGFVFVDNTVQNPQALALSAIDVQNVNISRNSFLEVGETGIEVFKSAPVLIADNNIVMKDVNFNEYAIIQSIKVASSNDVRIRNNSIVSPIGEALNVISSTNVSLSNNYVHDSAFSALNVFNSPQTLIDGNIFVNNSQQGELSSTILISDSMQTIVQNNTILYSTNAGIELTNSPGTVITENTIAYHPIGVFVGISSDTQIIGNQFFNNSLDVQIDASDRVSVVGINVVETIKDPLPISFSMILGIIPIVTFHKIKPKKTGSCRR